MDSELESLRAAVAAASGADGGGLERLRLDLEKEKTRRRDLVRPRMHTPLLSLQSERLGRARRLRLHV